MPNALEKSGPEMLALMPEGRPSLRNAEAN